MPVTPLFENRDFLIVNKPEGSSIHSENGEGFVLQATKALGYTQLFPVHRLDKMTSGLLILAKDAAAASALGRLFEERLIEKFYIAISTRKPKKKQGWVKGDMLAARRGSYKLLTTTDNPAVTRFISVALRVHERFFLIKPYTGKTHQIRVALKSLGAPVAGDIRYAQADEARKEDRGYLHAFGLRFLWKGETVALTALPENGERFHSPQAMEQLRIWADPWDFFDLSK